MSCLPVQIEEEFNALFDKFNSIGRKPDNNWLAFCAQYNEYSGYVPSKNTFCGHIWSFQEGLKSIVNYGGVMVYGVHAKWKCKHCGKLRFKIYKGEPFKVYNRKQIAEFYATGSWGSQPRYRQMEF